MNKHQKSLVSLSAKPFLDLLQCSTLSASRLLNPPMPSALELCNIVGMPSGLLDLFKLPPNASSLNILAFLL